MSMKFLHLFKISIESSWHFDSESQTVFVSGKHNSSVSFKGGQAVVTCRFALSTVLPSREVASCSERWPTNSKFSQNVPHWTEKSANFFFLFFWCHDIPRTKFIYYMVTLVFACQVEAVECTVYRAPGSLQINKFSCDEKLMYLDLFPLTHRCIKGDMFVIF